MCGVSCACFQSVISPIPLSTVLLFEAKLQGVVTEICTEEMGHPCKDVLNHQKSPTCQWVLCNLRSNNTVMHVDFKWLELRSAQCDDKNTQTSPLFSSATAQQHNVLSSSACGLKIIKSHKWDSVLCSDHQSFDCQRGDRLEGKFSSYLFNFDMFSHIAQTERCCCQLLDIESSTQATKPFVVTLTY